MSFALVTLMSNYAQCDECEQWMESGFVDDYGCCIDCDYGYNSDDDSQPDEEQEWHDFDQDC